MDLVTGFVPYSKLYSFEELKDYQPLPPTEKIVQAYWRTHDYNLFDSYDSDSEDSADCDIRHTYLLLTIKNPNNVTIALELSEGSEDILLIHVKITSYFTDSINSETIIKCHSIYDRDDEYRSGKYRLQYEPEIIKPIYENLKEKEKLFDYSIIREYLELNKEFIPLRCQMAMDCLEYIRLLKVFY